MKLISLSLQNYRRFSDVEVEFPDGVTGIIGLNGVGKSSLVEAIAWVLYGHDATRTKKEGIKRSQAPEEMDCGAKLKLEMNGDCYEISRRLRGASLSTEARIQVNGKELARSADRTTKEVERFLGMDRRSFFRSFYARQKDLNVLSGVTPRDRKDVIIKMLRIDAIDKAIENVRGDRRDRILVLDTLRSQMTGKEKTKRDLEEIEEKLKGLRDTRENRLAEVGDLDSAIRALKEELGRLDQLKDVVSGVVTKHGIMETELKNVSAVILDLDDRMSRLAEDEKRALELSPMVEDLDRLRAEEERLVQVGKEFMRRQSLLSQYEKSMKRKTDIESRLRGGLARADELDTVVKREAEAEESAERIRRGIEDLTARKSACEAELSMLAKSARELDERSKQISTLGRDARCPTCGRELGDDYGRITEHFGRERDEIGERMGEKESEIEVLADRISKGQKMQMVADRELKSLRKKRIDCEKGTEEMTQLLVLKGELEKDVAETSGLLRNLGDVEYDEEAHQNLKREIGKKSAVREELTAYRTKLDSRAELRQKTAEAEEQRAILRKELESLKGRLNSIDYSEARHAEAKSESEQMTEQLRKAQAKLHSVELDLKSVTDRLQWLKSNLDEIAEKEGRIDELRAETGKLARLSELFVDFRLQLIQKARPRLSLLASSLFERMTDGRYQGIELSEDYEMFLVEAGDRYSIDRFSGGETDLANLSLRLAISELILEATGNQLSFIILDEIFGSQDMIRKGLIMEALKEISRRFRQILLITHVEEIKDSLENVIEVWENEEGVSVVRQG